MSTTSQGQFITSLLETANLTATIATGAKNVGTTDSFSAITTTVHVTAPPPEGPHGYFTGAAFDAPTTFSGNGTAWQCDSNGSRLWQLTHPVCTTRYDNIVAFVAVAAILAFITLWTVLGNGLVLVALYKYRSLRTMSNCLIGNLAISDLFLATTVLPVSTANDLLGYWLFGDLACTLWLCMDVLYCTASVWGLCTVAFDRYLATAYPVWYHDKRSVRKAVACVVFVWIFSIIISLAPFIGWQHMIPNFFTFNRDLNRYECILFMSSSYVIYSSTGSFIIPTCLMTFMYIRIFKILHKQSKNMKKKMQARKSSRRKAIIPNGCPTIRVPDGEEGDTVVRDFTTTTLVSLSAIETSVYADYKEPDDTTFQQEHLLHVPRVSLHSANGIPSCNREPNARLDENTNTLKDNEALQSDNSLSMNTSGCYDLIPSNDAQRIDTSFKSSKPSDVDKVPTPQRRSNSLCTVPGNVTGVSPIGLLTIVDMERRNSHEGTVRQVRPSEQVPGHGTESHSSLLKPISHRSKSANVLTSSDDEGSVHSSKQTRRSLPCDLTTLRRNNKMTLSMKRRFELREQRATKRMLLIMACFCVCWMPFVVMYITRSLCHDCDMNTHLVAAIIWLGYVNSSLNPVLYSLFNDDFKNAFKKLLCLKSSSRQRRRR